MKGRGKDRLKKSECRSENAEVRTAVGQNEYEGPKVWEVGRRDFFNRDVWYSGMTNFIGMTIDPNLTRHAIWHE
jgi:hypothetical protein